MIDNSVELLSGLGPDAPTITNEQGGKQSHLNYRFDLIDPLTMFALARVCAYGAEKYSAWNWRRIDINSNLNHALTHIFAYLAGDTSDDHLEHAFTRLMFALSLHLTPGECERMMPKDPMLEVMP